MCDPTVEVNTLTYGNRTPYQRANRRLRDSGLDNYRDLLNTFPELYLQVVFLYFQDAVLRPPPAIEAVDRNLREEIQPLQVDMLTYLATFLRDFGWLPARYIAREFYYVIYEDPDIAVYEDRSNIRWLWDLYWRNGFYRTSITLTPANQIEDLPGKRAHAVLLDRNLWQEAPPDKAVARSDVMRGLLRDCFINYVIKVKLRLLDQLYPLLRDAPAELTVKEAYETRISFAVTLFRQFKTQVNNIVERMKNLSPRMHVLIANSFHLLNQLDDVEPLTQYCESAYIVLRQSARFVELSQEGIPPNYLRYLEQIQVYQMHWIWHTGNRLLQAQDHYNEPVNLDSLLVGSSDLLQSLNILPPMDQCTNGMLIELLVDHLVNAPNTQFFMKVAHFPRRPVTNPFVVRDQVIWFVSVATGWWKYLLSLQNRRSRVRLGVPVNFRL